MSLAVKPAQESDAEAAVEVIRQSILESCTDDHRGDADTIAKWLANKTVEHFLSWLANSDNYCVIAEVNDRLVGVGLLQRKGEIVLFYLSPGAQRQGIGTALHSALEDMANSWGLTKLTLDSTFRARPFYERLGYQPAGAARLRFGVLHSYPYEKVLRLI